MGAQVEHTVAVITGLISDSVAGFDPHFKRQIRQCSKDSQPQPLDVC